MSTAVNGSDSGETPMRWRPESGGREERKRRRESHKRRIHVRRPHGEGEYPHRRSMHTGILVRAPPPGHAFSVPTPPTRTPDYLVYSWWCTHKPTRWWSSIRKRSGVATLPNVTGCRCSGVAFGIADGVHTGVCMRISVSVWVRAPELYGYRTRDTLCYALSPPVAALCGTTRPPWFHSWLHWLIFVRCPRTLGCTCRYVLHCSSFITVKVDPNCNERASCNI